MKIFYVHLTKHNAYASLIRDWFSYFCWGGGGGGLENIGVSSALVALAVGMSWKMECVCQM